MRIIPILRSFGPVKDCWYDTFGDKVLFNLPPLGNCYRVTTSTKMMVVLPFLTGTVLRLGTFLGKISLFLYSTKDFQWSFIFGYSSQFGVQLFLIKSLVNFFLKFWNWVAIFTRVQPLTRFASMPSGSAKCFSTSFHNWSFTESGTTYGLLGFPFHSLYLMGMLSLTIAPHWDTNLSLTFFWSTRLTKI
jgi:hypothetical protein